MRPALLAVLLLAAAFTAKSLHGESRPDAAGAQGAQLRIVLPMLGREVLPDPGLESITVTATSGTSAAFRYRVRNVGGAPADLSRFTLRAWFSADEALQRDADVPAGAFPLSATLAPGASIEAEASAESQAAPIAEFPYLLVEVDSGGAVAESSLANNVQSARRPPPDLVFSPLISWEPSAAPTHALITWNFRGSSHGIVDAGFRVEVPGFGTQEVPAGTRSLTVPLGPAGERPCLARVAALRPGTDAWPTVESNNLCD